MSQRNPRSLASVGRAGAIVAVAVGAASLPGWARAQRPNIHDYAEIGGYPVGQVYVFSEPTYRDEDGMRFRYRFAGEPEWSSASAVPDVSFARLGHGSYALEVVAETDQGARGSDVLAVPFTVLPSWWQASWFQGLLALAIGAFIVLVPLLRGRHLEAERARLQALVRERTEELESKTRHLEAEIEERARAEEARERLRSQLWDVQKMKLAGRIAGGVAHDFNNLLTVVRVNAELLSEEAPDNQELQAGLREIRASADRGAELVSHLLAFSQRQVVHMERLNLVDALRDSLVVIDRMMAGRLDLRIRLPGEPLWVSGDRGQLNQAVVSLALNAQDAMPEGGSLDVTLRARAVEKPVEAPFCRTVPPGSYAVLTVEDTGEGMDADTLSRAFEPFFTTRALGEGTGLGLSSVYGIVETHHGFVHLASAPGKGTQVTLYLPLLEEPA